MPAGCICFLEPRNTRVSNELGAGRPRAAKFASQVNYWLRGPEFVSYPSYPLILYLLANLPHVLP